MKRGFDVLIPCSCLVATLMASCSKVENAGSSAVSVKMTLTASDDRFRSNVLDEFPYEGALHRLEYFLFDSSSGALALHGEEDGLGVDCWNTELKLPRGRYDCAFIANGPDLSDCSGMSQLRSQRIDFEEFNDAANGFCMVCLTSIDASGRDASLDCSLDRLVARVCLRSITNGLPEWLGNFAPEYCMLSNAVGGTCTVSGDAGDLIWLNRQGRAGTRRQGAGDIIDGERFLPDCGGQTFKFLEMKPIAHGETGIFGEPACLYSYPNDCRADPEPFQEDFTGSRTVLTVVGAVNGIRYYYPVILSEGLERGCSYAVDLTVCSLGSPDPCVPSEESGRKMTVRLEKWADGKEYGRNI